MSIAYQPATTAEPVGTRPGTRPEPARSTHAPVLVEEHRRAWTFVKIAGLLAITALGAALATAVILGAALFTALTIG